MITRDIAHLRLAAQSIADPYLTDPADVVRSLGAIQAQDYGQVLWAIGLRTKDSTLATVLESIESGKILRTWPMRGTIHFVPAEDAKWMISLVGERSLRSASARHAGLELDERIFRKAEELFREALGGGQRLTRPALMKLLEDNGIATRDQRGYHILWTLSLLGVLCIGPMEGKQQTFALLDEWVPQAQVLTREEGLGELARRYFTGHGPATVADFAAWSSQTLTDAKRGLEAAKPHLASEIVDGATYWFGRDRRTVSTQSLGRPYLLAGFEEYLLGYKDRTAVIVPERAVASYTNGIFFPIIVVDGQVVGLWKRTIRRNDILVSFTPFVAMNDAALTEIKECAHAYGKFMGLPIVFLGS